MNATIAMNDGDTHNGPSEQVEAKYPLLVERYCLRPDSGGAGKFRGGLGAEQVVQARHPIRFSSLMERARCKPWGLFDGLSGSGNAVAVHRYNIADETHFPSAKALNQVLQPGDAYIIRSGGGGGYGSPLERDLATLEHDVRCGYVTKEAAENHYGAVFRPDSLVLDIEATKARRAEMHRQGLPHDEPITEIIIPFPTAPQAQARSPEHEKMTEEERVAFAMQCRCCR